jgi:hypothetical protein
MLFSKSVNFALFGMAAGCALGVGADRIYLVLPDNPPPSSLSPQAAMGLPLPPQSLLPARTVEWFVAHPDVAAGKVKLCNNDPGNAMSDPECQNAYNATEKIGFDQILSGAKR